MDVLRSIRRLTLERRRLFNVSRCSLRESSRTGTGDPMSGAGPVLWRILDHVQLDVMTQSRHEADQCLKRKTVEAAGTDLSYSPAVGVDRGPGVVQVPALEQRRELGGELALELRDRIEFGHDHTLPH